MWIICDSVVTGEMRGKRLLMPQLGNLGSKQWSGTDTLRSQDASFKINIPSITQQNPEPNPLKTILANQSVSLTAGWEHYFASSLSVKTFGAEWKQNPNLQTCPQTEPTISSGWPFLPSPQCKSAIVEPPWVKEKKSKSSAYFLWLSNTKEIKVSSPVS